MAHPGGRPSIYSQESITGSNETAPLSFSKTTYDIENLKKTSEIHGIEYIIESEKESVEKAIRLVAG